MASSSLPPSKDNPLQMFVRAQFLTKCIPPPPSTDFTGKTAIITGGNSGIGLETGRVMLEFKLSHLILAVRTAERGEEVAAAMRKDHPKATIEVWQCEMLSYDSIQACVRRCGTLKRLDMAILNAGLGNVDWAINPSTGHEETFQVNYLSTALMALLLLPVLRPKRPSDKPGRLMIVASGMGLTSKFPNRNADPLIPSFDDSTGWGTIAAMERYSVTKTMVMMLVQRLGQIVDRKDVIITAVEPGLTGGTALQKDVHGPMRYVFALMKALAGRSPRQAAWTYVDAVAVKGEEAHGSFVMNWGLHPFHTMMYEPEGKQTTERLWNETLKELSFAGVQGIVDSMAQPPAI